MLLSPQFQTYGDSQAQNNDPIGPQPEIPAGVHDIELTWDRHTGYMRIIINEQKWWFKEFLGRGVVVSTDNERGRLYLRSMARISGETLTLYRGPDEQPHPKVEDRYIKYLLEPTHNRLCYRRETKQWRIRDERKDWNNSEALKFVEAYIGDLVAEWDSSDPWAHIYHNGYAIIDTDDICHLYDASI